MLSAKILLKNVMMPSYRIVESMIAVTMKELFNLIL